MLVLIYLCGLEDRILLPLVHINVEIILCPGLPNL